MISIHAQEAGAKSKLRLANDIEACAILAYVSCVRDLKHTSMHKALIRLFGFSAAAAA
jgi:hypothetical protein